MRERHSINSGPPTHRRKVGYKSGGALTMASAECEPIMGSGTEPPAGYIAEPLVRGREGPEDWTSKEVDKLASCP